MIAEASPTCLQIDGLTGGYGKVTVLRGIDLRVAADSIVGVLGHNGMGKTTLLKAIMGFVAAQSGSVRFDDVDITRLKPHRRAALGIGYVPQGRGIFSQLTVRDNLRYGWHGDRFDEETSLTAILDDFPRLQPLLDRHGGTLSGGEQQQLTLARCLMGDPDLLLLDEPTEGVQPSIIEEIGVILLRIKKERGLTILLVEQNFDFIVDLSDRVLVLEGGRIAAELSRAEFSDRTQVDRFLGFGAARTTRTTRTTHSGRHAHAAASVPVSAADHHPPVLPADLSLSSPRMTKTMTVKRPGPSHMRALADRFGMSLSNDELAQFSDLMEPFIQAYDRLDAAADHRPEVRYPRSPGYHPDPVENALNAWYVKTDIKGAPDGPLRGKRIALKDNVCLAGVPMMNGSAIMEGYIPEIDATIVTRILDAGGVIAGKAHCENFCLSGGSHTNAKGPVHNPWKRGYTTGGSSSGSAALVAAGEVPMAIAGDQGGSIRMPASNCGVYGMKATHGLVPYTGVMPIERTIDHVGPITATVADNALLLEVIAGVDGLDSRQADVKTYRYTEALGRGVGGLRIGVVEEGFNRPESEADVDDKVRAAADRLRDLGARVEAVSIPEHALGLDCWTAIAAEGLQDHMMHGNSGGSNYKGLYQPSLMDWMAQWRNRADELSHSLKLCMFMGEYFRNDYRGRFYGKAQNLMRKVTSQYAAALKQYDLLLLPTVPMKPQPIPPPDCSIAVYVARALEMVGNTAPFNGSGMPAMSIPCGLSEGLPIGMMLVGPFWGEMKIYQAADAFEHSGNWHDF